MIRNSFKRALTLIELVVVLLILVALASLVIPQLGGFVERTHASTSSDGIAELTRTFQLTKTSTFKEPDGFDSLVVDATGTAINDGVPGATGATAAGGDLIIATVTAAQVTALNNAGITQLFDMPNAPAGASKTFGIPFGASRTITGDQQLVTTNATAVSREFGASAVVNDPTVSYVVFGVGENSSLVGSRIVEAPIHLGEANDPNNEYSRYVAVYAVTDAVKLVGICAIDDDGLKGLKGHVADYYESANNG